MKKVIFLIGGIIIIWFYCNSDCNISSLSSKRVEFIELPIEVKAFYKDPTKFGDSNASMMDFICLDEIKRYQLETVKTWIGPWISYYKLINIESNISYKIEQGTPLPFVVYDDKLYLVGQYNIFFVESRDFNTVEFTCYTLKEK